MQRTETITILQYIAAIDNREITEPRIDAWHEAIGHLDYELTRQAVVLCRQDATITYLEPKHIVAKYGVLRERQETDKRRETALEAKHEATRPKPAPKCVHDLNVAVCNPCSTWLWRNHKANHANAPEGDPECMRIIREKEIPLQWERTGAFANPKR